MHSYAHTGHLFDSAICNIFEVEFKYTYKCAIQKGGLFGHSVSTIYMAFVWPYFLPDSKFAGKSTAHKEFNLLRPSDMR